MFRVFWATMGAHPISQGEPPRPASSLCRCVSCSNYGRAQSGARDLESTNSHLYLESHSSEPLARVKFVAQSSRKDFVVLFTRSRREVCQFQ